MATVPMREVGRPPPLTDEEPEAVSGRCGGGVGRSGSHSLPLPLPVELSTQGLLPQERKGRGVEIGNSLNLFSLLDTH